MKGVNAGDSLGPDPQRREICKSEPERSAQADFEGGCKAALGISVYS